MQKAAENAVIYKEEKSDAEYRILFIITNVLPPSFLQEGVLCVGITLK